MGKCKSISLTIACLLLWMVQVTHQEDYPLYPLYSCDLICQSCTSRYDSSSCSKCEAGLTLSSSGCALPPGETYYNNTKLDSQFLADNISDFVVHDISSTRTLASPGDVIKCVNPSNTSYFAFEVAGMFKSSYYVESTFTFSETVEAYYVTFMTLFFLSPMDISVSIDRETAFTTTLNANNSNVQNYTKLATSPVTTINCNFTYDSMSLRYQKVRSGRMTGTKRKITLRISANYSFDGNDYAYWGIRDVAVFGIKCKDCVSDDVFNTAKILGIVIGCIVGAIILLMIPLCIIHKLKNVEIIEERKKIMYSSNNKVQGSQINLINQSKKLR